MRAALRRRLEDIGLGATTVTMTTWKRWSWRYRLLALGALLLLLQGASCPVDLLSRPTYVVPTTSGNLRVIGEAFTDEQGRSYFLVEDVTPGGARGLRRVYPGTAEYFFLVTWFEKSRIENTGPFDRSGIPGAASTLPAPPVQ